MIQSLFIVLVIGLSLDPSRAESASSLEEESDSKTNCTIDGKDRSLIILTGDEAPSPTRFRLHDEHHKVLSEKKFKPSTDQGEKIAHLLFEAGFRFKCLDDHTGFFSEYCSPSSSGDCGRIDIQVQQDKLIVGSVKTWYPEADALRAAKLATKRGDFEGSLKILSGEFLKKYSNEIADQAYSIAKILASQTNFRVDNNETKRKLKLADRAMTLYFVYYANDNAKIKPQPQAVQLGNDIAFYEYKLKNHTDAEALLNQVVSADPNRSVAWLNLGDVLTALKKDAAAEKAYAKHKILMNQ